MSEVAVRLPSVLLSTGVVAIVHRLGTLTIGARAGFYGAMLAATGGLASTWSPAMPLLITTTWRSSST